MNQSTFSILYIKWYQLVPVFNTYVHTWVHTRQNPTVSVLKKIRMFPMPILVPPKNGTASFTYWKDSESKNLFVKTSKTRRLMNYYRGDSFRPPTTFLWLHSRVSNEYYLFCLAGKLCMHGCFVVYISLLTFHPLHPKAKKRELIMNEWMNKASTKNPV
jgi:hypothetical protein